MKKLAPLLVLVSALALLLGTPSASALGGGKPTRCAGGTLPPGTYNGLTVTGTCVINGAVTINGNVDVENNAYLDAAYLNAVVTINGNVFVERRAKFGLGCTFGYHDCGLNPAAWTGKATVNGNVVATQALTVYLDFTTIDGSILVLGGGDITMVDTPQAGGLVLPIKDNTVRGGITVLGWQGAWFGIIRNVVGGSVIAAKTVGTRVGEDGRPDSTEIVTNHIAGNLICIANSPPAQIGDSGGTVNTVGGRKLGECTAV